MEKGQGYLSVVLCEKMHDCFGLEAGSLFSVHVSITTQGWLKAAYRLRFECLRGFLHVFKWLDKAYEESAEEKENSLWAELRPICQFGGSDRQSESKKSSRKVLSGVPSSQGKHHLKPEKSKLAKVKH